MYGSEQCLLEFLDDFIPLAGAGEDVQYCTCFHETSGEDTKGVWPGEEGVLLPPSAHYQAVRGTGVQGQIQQHFKIVFSYIALFKQFLQNCQLMDVCLLLYVNLKGQSHPILKFIIGSIK